MIYFSEPRSSPRSEFIATRLGSRSWVVARRLTDRLKRSGYEVAVTEKRLREIEREWEHANPAAARMSSITLHELRLSDDELAAVVQALGRLKGDNPAADSAFAAAVALQAKGA